ncbi:TIGR03085 family protein [Gordonia spumicola]|uniref:TIGR03085 family protein n=1 Tax=Gordonia spumicola TaxID=589161 RepID=A0A7I9VB10_9ACTN|nr:TIGR03085 family metal-binding protein [Gordonia spumicola]GEE02556.1 TIGR03085 family protein [Gordonia spumicola]
MSLARDERAALVATLRSVGPDAPTMCEGWTARDLAVHLAIRERRLDAAAAMVLPPLAGHARSVEASYAAKPWPVLMRTVLDGPPWYSPFRPLDAVVNLAEMFVHHEDLLRGGADRNGPFLPRKLSPEMNRALETPLSVMGRLTLAKSPARVTLGSPDGRELLTVGRGEAVTVTGTVGELLLFAFGRAPVDVTVTGSDSAVGALLKSERSI